ncbi:MAG: apolipoprotein N-acyltransferase [Bdellovibrionales bacterium]
MRFSQKLFDLTTSHPCKTALICGLLSALALPPVGAWPVLFLTFPVFFFTLHHTPTTSVPKRQGFWRGWLFAFGYHVAGLYWIANSMLVDAEKFWWAIPFAVAGLPAYFALYAGLMCAIFVLLINRYKMERGGRVFVFAALWMLGEVARSRFLTGFEWNLLATVWDNTLPMLQIVSIFGVYGLSLLTILLALSPVLFASKQLQERMEARAILAFTLFCFLWGLSHLAYHPTQYTPGVQLRLVQPNIPQELKWDPAKRDQNFMDLLALSDVHAALTPTHIIWPEAAAPFALNKAPEARLEIGLRAPTNGAVITGSLWRDDQPGDQKRYTNSLVAINAVGSIAGRYDKFHLVPFGEYFPLRDSLAALGLNVTPIAAGSRDFSFGPGPQTLMVENAPPVSPLICYEVIFSGEVVDRNNPPQWILNLTNDAWFGTSSGPYQHFASARLRAIEEGLPVVRVANTGISGVIDSYGRITAATELNTRVVMDHGLPVPAAKQTPFSRHSHVLFLILTALMLLWAVVGKRVVAKHVNAGL